MAILTLKRWFILALPVYILFGYSPIWAMTCGDFLAEKPSLKATSPNGLKEKLPILVSRIRPTYVSDSFDVRIVSDSLFKGNVFSPTALREQTINTIFSMQAAFRDMGFNFQSYIQVLVEAHTNAIKQLVLEENHKEKWVNHESNTPWVNYMGELIGIPNILGFSSVFFGKSNNMGFSNMPRILVLNAFSKTYHFLSNRYIIAHELGHITEIKSSHLSLIWREARADLLAYLMTGETRAFIPEGIIMETVRSNGITYKETKTTIRSLLDPTVPSIDFIYPYINAYHYNSEIISSTLYEMSQKLGTQKLIDFILWMDGLKDTNLLIPKLEPLPESKDDKSKPGIQYVNSKNSTEVREAIRSHMLKFGHLLRQWSMESGVAPVEYEYIDSLLKDRGI